eukprot:4504-Heterococcus_DN1.PRE.1
MDAEPADAATEVVQCCSALQLKKVKKNRGVIYRCKRCGEPKKGHTCIFTQQDSVRSDVVKVSRSAAVQVELDSASTVRALNTAKTTAAILTTQQINCNRDGSSV